jgi:L-seryl-tRNA(Ser) seleniumtransferase
VATKQELALLPSVDSVLCTPEISVLGETCDPVFLTELVRTAVGETRKSILVGNGEHATRADLLAGVVAVVLEKFKEMVSPRYKKVINATGIVLHTNMGRAPLPQQAIDQIAEVAGGYSNLELDLETGSRGSRTDLIEDMLCRLTSAEAAAVVNNNAAAVLISLNTLSNGKDALVSRGELVEIGGSFRIPDIMSRSGAKMVEVGTTNRTHLEDFETAITEQTGAMLAVHPSNYRVLGFTAGVSLEKLVTLGASRGVPVIHDLGGGILVDLKRFGLPHEPVVSESVIAGADVVTFSGDKVLGGPQAGVIVGKREAIEAIRKNPLMRALRCGKLTYAALEATLKLFLNPEALQESHPTLRMFTESTDVLQERGEAIVGALADISGQDVTIQVGSSIAQAGSGTLPLEEISSVALVVQSKSPSVNELATRLRRNDPPIMGYLQEDRLFLDLRTVDEKDLAALEAGLRKSISA